MGWEVEQKEYNEIENVLKSEDDDLVKNEAANKHKGL